MYKSGVVSRGEHSAAYSVSDGNVRIRSTFGELEAPLKGERPEELAVKMLGLQMGFAARRSPNADKEQVARTIRSEWQEKWEVAPPARWVDRPPPPEVVAAVESGWLPATGRMIDLGCGTAEIAAWFAGKGYQATGVDIAQAAVDRAALKHAHLAGSIEFFALDLCTETVPGPGFDILIDRGCLHQLPPALIGDYVRNLAAMAVPGAKLMLFAKAFRAGNPFGHAGEVERKTNWIRRVFARDFELEQASPTYLNPQNEDDPLPGMAFWLIRTG